LVERRSPKPEVAGSMPATPAKTVKKNMKFNPAKYLREVRQEVSKVTWPSKRETFTSAGIVLVVISIAAIILMLLDQFFSFIVRIVLG
jgi:preprotein translocase subunit SecE